MASGGYLTGNVDFIDAYLCENQLASFCQDTSTDKIDVSRRLGVIFLKGCDILLMRLKEIEVDREPLNWMCLPRRSGTSSSHRNHCSSAVLFRFYKCTERWN